MNSYLSVLVVGRINSQNAVDFHIRILFLKNTNNMFHFQLISRFHFVIYLKGEYKFTAATAEPLSLSKVNWPRHLYYSSYNKALTARLQNLYSYLSAATAPKHLEPL